MLEKFIPEGYYQTESEFLARVEEDAVSFRPPGEKIASYTRVAQNNSKKGKGAAVTLPEDDPDAIVYEVWHVRASTSFSSPCAPLTLSQATWKDPGFREYHRRMQLFILLYIEAGSFIKEEEESWEFVVL
jgi:histone acetyltransferase 1